MQLRASHLPVKGTASSSIEQAYVQGREIDMMDIHKQPYQKYSEKVRQVKASQRN
jgi:hypothetical protein